ncbi:MAG: single-stranded-DNA-specific exonuclease RecJ [Planctomycetaceae bacterium]|nr:single-stranded-DNA-specific exonuclease RecJ [Planctomycetaceae bacterium]
MPRKWTFHPHDEAAIRRLSQQLRVTPLTAQVLIARGFSDPESARGYLQPKLVNLHEPNLLPGVSEAARRVTDAVRNQRRITIYGDYDVDGVTATAILWHCLTLAGAKVDYYIPCRLEEGYGLNEAALRQLHDEDPSRLVVSVDCGIASVAEAAVAAELGLELIVTDHHHIGGELPASAVLVHPRLPGSEYPFGELCGAGVAFKLAWAVCQLLGDGQKATPRMREYLKSAVGLAAIGTVADVVPLVDENRIIVRYGMHSLKADPSIGLQSLLKVSGLFEKPLLNAEDIAFGLAPRINAAGRLGQARLAVELLTTSNPERAVSLAAYVDELNKNRKTVERRILKEAKELVAAHPDWIDQPVLVLSHHDWHPGVIGIVASRVAETYEKPAVMISVRDDGTGQGSARSFAGFDMYAGLEACREVLLSFGGHRAAAGLRVDTKRIDELRTTINNWASVRFSPTDDDTALRVDAEVHLSEVTARAVRELEHLGPFGEANPKPRFAATRVDLAEPPRTMGDGDRHLQLRIRQHRTRLRAIAFGRGEWAQEIAAATGPLSISFAPQINSFNGYERVELQLHDWKIPDE